MLIVADSSALIALATCNGLGFLTKLYGDIKVPQAVYKEVIVPDKPQANILSDFLVDRVVHIDLSRFVITAGGLGQGEVEAMALYKSLTADFLLIDDNRARLIAEANDIRCIGALGILLLAKQRNLVNEIKSLVQLLKESPIRYSEDLLEKVLQLANE